jgi:ribosomal-protein-alanine N-acetyltransferase
MNLKAIFSEIPVIQTDRFILREIVAADAEPLFFYYHNEEVTKFLDWYGPNSIERAEEAIKHWETWF